MLLIQGVYLYEYMDEWENFNETTLPNIAFKSNLNMEYIKNSDYNYARSFRKDFETKSSEEYHDFYFKRNALLLADVLENFRKMCLDIYQLDSTKFISGPRLAWQAALKNTIVEVKLLKNIDILLMVENKLG